MKPTTPNLRTWDPKAGDAKNVEDTTMLNTQAREPSFTKDGEGGAGKEDVNSTPSFGSLGATGRS